MTGEEKKAAKLAAKKCFECQSKFSPIRKKHFCSICMNVYCDDCCNRERMVGGAAARVCNGCETDGNPATRRLNALQVLGMRAEKKLLGDLSTQRGVVDAALTDEMKGMLNAFSQFVEHRSGEETAAALRKSLIKVIVKVVVLARHDRLSSAELGKLRQVRSNLRKAFDAIITFHETPFTYDQEMLSKLFSECEEQMALIVVDKLSGKSVARVHTIFGYLRDAETISPLFEDATYKQDLARLAEALHKVLDSNF